MGKPIINKFLKIKIKWLGWLLLAIEKDYSAKHNRQINE